MVVVLNKVRIDTCLQMKIKFNNVKYVCTVDSVNFKVCCESIRTYRDNECFLNLLLCLISLIYMNTSQKYNVKNITLVVRKIQHNITKNKSL